MVPFDFHRRYALPAKCARLQSCRSANLRIVKRTNGVATLGVCERCNAQFKDANIQTQFDAHNQ